MGNTANISQKDLADLKKNTNFNEKQLKRIYRRFRKLDHFNKGYVSTSDFATIPEIDKNPLKTRICEMLSSENKESPGTQEINFIQFATTLSVFTDPSNHDGRTEFMFRVYDINKDGYIDSEEMLTILKYLVGQRLSQSQLTQIVERTINDLDTDHDNKLSRSEFKMVFDQLSFEGS